MGPGMLTGGDNPLDTLLERYPIVLALPIWNKDFKNKCICFHSDNEGVVEIINSQTSKNIKVMHFIRQLVLTCLQVNNLFKSVHIKGVRNVLADALSRLPVDNFRALAPHTAPVSVSVPPLPRLPP